MREKRVEEKIKDYLFSKGAYYFKVHGSAFMPKGIPDIVVCYKGCFIGLEIKAPGKLYNQSPEQKIHMDNIIKSDGYYLLVDDLSPVKELMEYIDEQRSSD